MVGPNRYSQLFFAHPQTCFPNEIIYRLRGKKKETKTNRLKVEDRVVASYGDKLHCDECEGSPPRADGFSREYLEARSLVWTVWEDQSGDIPKEPNRGPGGDGSGRRDPTLALALLSFPPPFPPL